MGLLNLLITRIETNYSNYTNSKVLGYANRSLDGSGRTFNLEL